MERITPAKALYASDEPIKIGVSSCLLGEQVRFDGGHKRSDFLVDTLGGFVEFVPVCPEMEIGLGVPRETLRLVRDGNAAGIARLVTNKTGVDHTDKMNAYAEQRVNALGREQLSGYVDAKLVLDELNTLVVRELKKEGSICLAGLGIFRKRKPAARIWRNPATGEQIKIPARTRLRFTPAKALKKSVLEITASQRRSDQPLSRKPPPPKSPKKVDQGFAAYWRLAKPGSVESSQREHANLVFNMNLRRTGFGLTLPQRATLFGAATWDQLLDLARMADRHELFESVWVGDSAMAKPRPDSLPILGALSAVTTRVRLGVGCMASFALREPVFFAEQWSTLDFISKGRMQLAVCTGIGLGGTSAGEGAVWGIRDSERGARMAENIDICRRLWREEQASFAGTFRSFSNASINPKPVQQPCPIWIAANPKPALSGKPLRRVAEIADGWMVAQVWPGLFSTLWRRLSKHLIVLGKDPELFPNIAYHNIHLAHDRATALAETRRFLHEYYGPVFSAEQAEGWTAAGTPAECVEDLNRLVRAGAKAITLRVTGWNQREQFDRIVAEVLPHVECPQPSGGL